MRMVDNVITSIEEEFKHRMQHGKHKGQLAGNIIFSATRRTPLGEVTVSEVRLTKDANETTLFIPSWLVQKFCGDYVIEECKDMLETHNGLYRCKLFLNSDWSNYRQILKTIQFLIKNTF